MPIYYTILSLLYCEQSNIYCLYFYIALNHEVLFGQAWNHGGILNRMLL